MVSESGKKLIGLSSFEMLAMFRRGLFYAYLTIYLRHYLGLSVTATTLFATLPMVVNVLSQNFIWGRISDYFQIRRSLIVAGEITAAVCTVGVWYLHRLPASPVAAGYIIIAGLTTVEFFWSMSNISWSALISDLYPEKERSSVQGRLASMGGLGRIVGIWMGGLFYDGLRLHYAGWGFYQGHLFFMAAAVMLVSVLPLFLLPEGGVNVNCDRSSTPSSKIPIHASTTELRRYLIFLAGMTLINFGRNSIAIIFPQYLSASAGLHLDSRTLSYILNTQSVAMVCIGWMVGRLCQKMGLGRALLAGTSAAITALVLLWATPALPAIFFSSFLRGVADVVILASAYAAASIYIPAAKRARRFAWFNATFFLSWGLPGTMIIGPLVDYLIATGLSEPHAYRFSFLVAAVMTSLGLVIQVVLLFGKKAAPGDG
ncbi:MAG: MFS transporter [Desulfobacteraceae bacterium]